MTNEILGFTLNEDHLTAMAGAAMEATGGHPAGHGKRSAYLGIRFGEQLGLDDVTLATVRHAAQVEAAGCPKNDALTQWLWGSDPAKIKRDATIVHRDCLKSAARMLVTHALAEAPLHLRFRRMLDLMFNKRRYTKFAYQVRCTYGTYILGQMGYSPAVIEAVNYGNEHHDGSGGPYALKGDKIPITSQLVLFGRFVASVVVQRGVDGVEDLLSGLPGRWFRRELKRAFKAINTSGLWRILNDPVRLERELARYHDDAVTAGVSTERMNRVSDALAEMQGTRDPFTAGHQNRVADIAVLLAVTLGLPIDQVNLVRWAALLHDLGKLRVALAILLKNGKLTSEERAKMEIHPQVSLDILSHAQAYEEIAAYAGAHHERFEGGGYPSGLSYPFGLERFRNPLIACIITVADVIDALISERPYRGAMPLPEAYDLIVNKMRGHFHPVCLAAMQTIWGSETFLAIVGRCQKANEDLILRMPEAEFEHFKEQQRRARAR
jgi:HD-GYP domain-containing protein (c-di-GMP phosphodiesterase class II)